MSSIIQTRIDNKTREKAEAIFRQMGMSLSDGIRIFICQVINDRALPFQPSVSREFKPEVARAMQDALEEKNLIGPFDNVDDVLKYLDENGTDEEN